MSRIVKCPVCGTVKSVTRNMQFKCQGCGARITVGNDEQIKSVVPKK